MIAQAQPQWSHYPDIDNSGIVDNDSNYDIIEPCTEIRPEPIVTNPLSTLVMHDPGPEFPELFSEEKIILRNTFGPLLWS